MIILKWVQTLLLHYCAHFFNHNLPLQKALCSTFDPIFGTSLQPSLTWINETLKRSTNTLGIRRNLLALYAKSSPYDHPWSAPNEELTTDTIKEIEEYAAKVVSEVQHEHAHTIDYARLPH